MRDAPCQSAETTRPNTMATTPAAPRRSTILALLAVAGASIMLHDVDAFVEASRPRRQLGGARRVLDTVSNGASRVGGGLLTTSSAVVGEPVFGFVADTVGSLPVVNDTVDALADKLVRATIYTSADGDGVRLQPSDCASLRASGFDASRPTKVLTHGYLVHAGQGTGLYLMKDALLGQDAFNVILYDWQLLDPKVYPLSATTAVDVVGRKIARDLAALSACDGLQASSLHLVGHSLGAHIVGWAAEKLADALGEQAQVVTGLDAAGPFFSNTSSPLRLNAAQAQFVYNIHTDGGLLGMQYPTAALDIFVNGGQHPQPGCSLDALGPCSHCFVMEAYLQALLQPRLLVAKKCASWDDFTAKHCEFGQQTELGLGVDKTARGSYFLSSDLSTARWVSLCGYDKLTGSY